MLVEMGFDVANCTKALELNNNSFDAALEMLLNKKDILTAKTPKNLMLCNSKSWNSKRINIIFSLAAIQYCFKS